MKQKISTLLIAMAFLGTPVAAVAETVVRSGDVVSLSNDQSVDGDFYAAAGVVSLSGQIAGDAFVAGGRITINGVIEEDLAVVGGTIQVHAPVGDDLRVAGGEVTLADSVAGDVFVLGGALHVLSTATVGGNVYFFGGDATIDGDVHGSVLGVMDALRVNGPVGGNIEVTTARAVTLGDRAAISGSVLYTSSQELVRSTQAVVEGEISQREGVTVDPRSLLQQLLSILLIWLFSTFTLYLLLRQRLDQFLFPPLQQPLWPMAYGLGALFVTPFVILLLFFTVIGAWIGALLLWLYIGLVLFSFSLLAIVTGAALAKFAGKKEVLSFWWVLAGIATVFLLLLIPILGQLLLLGMMVFVLGLLVRRLYQGIR